MPAGSNAALSFRVKAASAEIERLEHVEARARRMLGADQGGVAAEFGDGAPDLDGTGVRRERGVEPDQAAGPVIGDANVEGPGDDGDELGGAGRRRRDAPERAVGAGKHAQGPDLFPEDAAVGVVELERQRIGGEPVFQAAETIAHRIRKVLDPDGGDRGAGARRCWDWRAVPRAAPQGGRRPTPRMACRGKGTSPRSRSGRGGRSREWFASPRAAAAPSW